jgi:hypothetical protein
MDTFDVNLLSQVKPLNQKMSISQEQLHLKRKVLNADKEKGRYHRRKSAGDSIQNEGESPIQSTLEEKENIIDIII